MFLLTCITIVLLPQRTKKKESLALQKNETVSVSDLGEEKTLSEKKKSHVVRNVIIAVLAVAVALGGAGTWAYATGVITPADAAAKYGTFDYLSEQEVTDYIELYKSQMGYGDASDEQWASFLATYNLTPERLRISTINELLTNITIENKAKEVGVSVSDEEIDATIQTLKDSFGVLDDSTWAQTLEMYGQTEEGLRETYRQALLKQKLCSQEVEMPEPTDDQVLEYVKTAASQLQATEASQASSADEYQDIMANSTGKEIKHSYKFAIKAAGDEITLDESNTVESVLSEFESSDKTVTNFQAILASYCNDDDLKSSNGAMGWDVDTDSYSEAYKRALEGTSVGSCSSVVTDGDEAYFIWVDQSYTLPYGEDDLNNLDLSAMPDSLREYFSDCESYALWQDASDEYIANLTNSMNVTLYPMPSDVPYNVDMSAYEVSDESSDESTETE